MRLKLIKILAMALVMGVLSPSATMAQTQGGAAGPSAPNDGIGVAVLDVERVLREAAAMNDIRRQITQQREVFTRELQAQEAQLRTENQELAKKRTLMSPEAFAEERRNFEQKVAESRRLTQTRSQQLEQANTEAVRKVQTVYNKVVEQLAIERGFGLVFRRASVVVNSPNIDVTGDVLARLDTQLPTVKVELPQ